MFRVKNVLTSVHVNVGIVFYTSSIEILLIKYFQKKRCYYLYTRLTFKDTLFLKLLDQYTLCFCMTVLSVGTNKDFCTIIHCTVLTCCVHPSKPPRDEHARFRLTSMIKTGTRKLVNIFFRGGG